MSGHESVVKVKEKLAKTDAERCPTTLSRNSDES